MNGHLLAATFLGVTMTTPAAMAQTSAASCDRARLLSTADAYVAALVAHDASKEPMEPSAKFTEQTKVLKVGEEGLWKSAVAAAFEARLESVYEVSPRTTGRLAGVRRHDS